jgi:uncharacterized protein (DUF302 family)
MIEEGRGLLIFRAFCWPIKCVARRIERIASNRRKSNVLNGIIHQGENMAISKIELERVSIISSKPFEKVVEALKAAVGRPDMNDFAMATKSARTFADLEAAIREGLGRTGFMLFMELDHGVILRKESGKAAPKMVRFIVGNPLIMKEMVKHVPDAGSYAPVTVLVDERADGVHLSYDRMASYLAPYQNSEALAVARELDSKIESLLRESAA